MIDIMILYHCDPCMLQVDTSLQEFSKQLAEKDRSMKEEQEEMQRKLKESIREKEAQMLAQLEAEKQAVIEEKQKVTLLC